MKDLGPEQAVLRKVHTVLPTVTINRRVVHFTRGPAELEISWTLAGLGQGRALQRHHPFSAQLFLVSCVYLIEQDRSCCE